jgi:hypothetical protein
VAKTAEPAQAQVGALRCARLGATGRPRDASYLRSEARPRRPSHQRRDHAPPSLGQRNSNRHIAALLPLSEGRSLVVEGKATDLSRVTLSPLLRWNPSTLMEAITWRTKAGSLGGSSRTSSSSWLPGVGSERKKRGSRDGIEAPCPRGIPFIAPVEACVSGSRPSDQPSMLKGASGAD